MANEGDNRNIGVYYKTVPATGPDTDSVEIWLSSQGTNVTPDLRMRHTRMVYQIGAISTQDNVPLYVTFNSPVNWADDSLHTLLLDNSKGVVGLEVTFSSDYNFLDNNPLGSRKVNVPAGKRGDFYMSIISGKLYVKEKLNSDTVSYI